MTKMEIEQIATRTDNYVYLIKEHGQGRVGVVDPSDAEPVIEALDRLGWELTDIINTHHHNDHTGGNLELKEKYGFNSFQFRDPVFGLQKDYIDEFTIEMNNNNSPSPPPENS